MNKEISSNISIKALSSLLADKNFISLSDEISSFNPFKVLKLESHEIRHSNVLAWLFNPNESHNLGTKFLEQFLYAVSSNLDKESEKIKTIQNVIFAFIKNSGFTVKVQREVKTYKNRSIDLIIECYSNVENTDSFVILIENKVYSKQSKNQLDDYLKFVEEKYDNSIILPVYLTLDENDEPSEDLKSEYFHITYFKIVEILKNLISYKTSVGNAADDFILYYIKILEELLGTNTKEQEFAKEIYRKYREIIDFILENGESSILEAGSNFIEKFNFTADVDTKLEKYERGNKRFFPFADTVIKNTTDGREKDWRNGNVCGYFFQLFEDKNTKNGLSGNLYLKVEVAPFDDSNKRTEFLNILKGNGFNFKGDGNSTYTRIQYKKEPSCMKIEDITSVDEISEKMKKLFEKTKDLRENLHKSIEKYNEK